MIFIMAAGEQARWEGDGFKQLLPIGDTTIIERILWQLKARQKPWHIIGRYLPYTPYGGSMEGGTITHFWGEKYHFLSSDTLATSKYWQERNTILLGDTIYSHATLDRILSSREPVRWFGNPWEIFALSFDDSVIPKIKKGLEETIKQAEQGKHLGKLRNFFRAYCDITGLSNDFKHKFFGIIDSITDYTNDIDTREEYENFLAQHLTTMIHDDNNYRDGLKQ